MTTTTNTTTDTATTTITTLAQAEAWAASTPELAGIPSFTQYRLGLSRFLGESMKWFGIADDHFYSVNRNGYYESSDNAYGGLDVSWAFQKQMITPDEVIDNYIKLCEEARKLYEEDAN